MTSVLPQWSGGSPSWGVSQREYLWYHHCVIMTSDVIVQVKLMMYRLKKLMLSNSSFTVGVNSEMRDAFKLLPSLRELDLSGNKWAFFLFFYFFSFVRIKKNYWNDTVVVGSMFYNVSNICAHFWQVGFRWSWGQSHFSRRKRCFTHKIEPEQCHHDTTDGTEYLVGICVACTTYRIDFGGKYGYWERRFHSGFRQAGSQCNFLFILSYIHQKIIFKSLIY